MKKEKEKKEKEKIEEKEKCVICGKETEYVFSIPIQKRKYYVVGFGQLCEDCGREFS